MHKRLLALVGMAGLLAGSGLWLSSGSAAARSSTITLHFFGKSVSSVQTTASGQPLSGQTQPVPGDHFEDTSVDYVGNHTHHAKNWTASDHIFCTVNSGNQNSVNCFGEFAIGGSLIYANNVTVTGQSNPTVIQISGGTGNYAGATGTVTSFSYSSTSNNSDNTLVIHLK
jgi:hypothetical protein